MTSRQKGGCAIAILTTFLVRMPIAYAGTILLYKHVNAPDIVWLLLWISLPIAFLIEVVSELMKTGVFGEES
jgi:hypothetical protein